MGDPPVTMGIQNDHPWRGSMATVSTPTGATGAPTVPQDFTSRMSEEQCHMAGSLVRWTLKVCVSGIRPAKSGMQPICMSYNILEVEFILH